MAFVSFIEWLELFIIVHIKVTQSDIKIKRRMQTYNNIWGIHMGHPVQWEIILACADMYNDEH